MDILRRWMDGGGWTVATLAAAIPVHEVNLRKYLAGSRPAWRVMERLAEISAGQVTPNDWLSAVAREAIRVGGGLAAPARPPRRRRRKAGVMAAAAAPGVGRPVAVAS